MAVGKSLSTVVHSSCCLKNQYNFYKTAMTSLLVPPMSVRGMTCLDRDAFATVVNIPILKLKKIVTKFEDITENDRQSLVGQYEYFSTKSITLKYENWRGHEILKAILPEDIQPPAAYSLVGHIMQLNLRDIHLPYKTIIGQVFLDKTPNVQTVVNKVNAIDTTFRYFTMEILAGEKNTVTTTKEHGCTYQFDFARVYWNPRLSNEHTRLIACMKKDDVLYDVFAGVGPFAVPAARKGVKVLANDLNPESYKWLQINVTANKAKMDQCPASLIVVGNEILNGQIVDTNTSYLARSLKAAGLSLQRVTVVPDVVDDIAKKVKNASQEYPVVFTSGGVGPTHDDVTYEAVAKAFRLKLESHQELLDTYIRMNPNQPEIKRLAIVPNPCKIINVKSTEVFPVISVKNVYILPGSPKYFEAAVDTIVPQLKGFTPLHFEHINIKLNKLSIVDILDKQAKRWDGKVRIGSYVQSEPQTFTKITLEGSKEAVAEAKEELLYYLPVQKLMNLEHGLSHFQMNALLEDNEAYIKCALNIVQECYDRYKSDEIFISFNGGKDCTAVLHLAAIVAKSRDISSLLCLYVTADSFPEVEAFVDLASKYYGLAIIRKPRPVRSAVLTLLEEKRNLKASLMGMRKDDPGSANLQPFALTDPDWPQLMRANPILNWSYNQVWAFLLKHNVPYCSLYDQGYTSLGNRSSTMKNPLLKDPNDPSSYLPAYTLTDKSAERRGRL
ncbi:FAD synthase isoform X3 [Harpegnathos saltator]|nr:FAD synthase isoform X3 [Harpegnathos saltator]